VIVAGEVRKYRTALYHSMPKQEAALFAEMSYRAFIEYQQDLCERAAELRRKSRELRMRSDRLRQDSAIRQQTVAAIVARLSQF
jgi:hypothetical protein